MKLTLAISSKNYEVDVANGFSLAIPLQFDGAQPNHFGVNHASQTTLEAGGFIGDTSRGGSCNVSSVTLVPHCNGTHTESVAHIVDQMVSVGERAQALMPSVVITVRPEHGAISLDSYTPELEENDQVISKGILAAELSEYDAEQVTALVVRTLPNPQVKMRAQYNDDNPPPFFTREAIDYLNEKGIQHLLVDFPSIDKMYDDGLLTNHHLFWNVEEQTHQLTEETATHKSVTEMIYVSDAVTDGFYLMSLNVAPFESDAAPSRPILYPLKELN